ncbi:hypothetical protein AWZ03_011459 [Drosophila navojoa]|uniref:Uncharacterized protein n=1 Tax=Drosophila navojoa TaxID=7232 RepID=A0A484AZS8_DRONA|nr:hypothetical protein AWZ03_011459 [Drosophila navojoa]
MTPEKSVIAYINHLIVSNFSYFWDEIDGYLSYFGGTLGTLTLTSVAASLAYYFATRPIPEKPLVPLENQSPLLEWCEYSNPTLQLPAYPNSCQNVQHLRAGE